MPAKKGERNDGQFKKGTDHRRHIPGTDATSSENPVRNSAPTAAQRNTRRLQRTVAACRHVASKPESQDLKEEQKSLRQLKKDNVKRFYDFWDNAEKELNAALARLGPVVAEGVPETAAGPKTQEGIDLMDRLWAEYLEEVNGGRETVAGPAARQGN